MAVLSHLEYLGDYLEFNANVDDNIKQEICQMAIWQRAS